MGGGPSAQLGTEVKDTHGVELGWINNITKHNSVARSDHGASAEVIFTTKRGRPHPDSQDPKHPVMFFIPSDTPPAAADLVAPPLVDAGTKPPYDIGGESVALSTSKYSTKPDANLGATATVTAGDAPSIGIMRDYRRWALDAKAKSGTLKTMTMSYAFTCYLVAWTRNDPLTRHTDAANELGPFTYSALAKIDWTVDASYDFVAAPPKAIGKPHIKAGKLSTFAATDARSKGCEVRGPKSMVTLNIRVRPPP